MQLKFRIALERWPSFELAVKLAMLALVMCAFITELRGAKIGPNMQRMISEKQLVFRLTKASSGRTTGGSRFSLELFEASDGITVSSRLDRFRSAELAHKELAKIIRTAEVIERKPKLDDAGRSLGERVILKFARSKSQVPRMELLWIDKTDLHRIASSSLDHILAFEKQFYP